MVMLTPEQIEDAARVMPDHVLATSFMDAQARPRGIALILFTHEIARARAVVSESGLAAIRLQWWRETIDQIYTGKVVRAQPTAIALAATIQEANLPRTLCDAMIDGYERELDSAPFQTWADVEAYLDATFGNLNRLSLLASGLPAISTRADAAARHAGIAWGLSYLIRSMPAWCLRRGVWLPAETSVTLEREGMFAGHVTPALRTALSLAQNRLVAARAHTNSALKNAALASHFPALAHASLARHYGKAAQPALGDKWTTRSQISLLERQVRITLSVALGRV